MGKRRSYFELLDALQASGCPICSLVIEDSQRYLDHLLYERVLDLPMRMELQESFGLCSWHAWQLPALSAICSPDTGFSIFACDLLRKFDYLARAMRNEAPKRRTLKSLLRKIPQRFLPRIKERQCPGCRHAMKFQYYHLKELADSIQDEEFFNAYKASQGICLPHFFFLQESFSPHPNFPILLELQIAKNQSLRTMLEAFIQKQDYRFRDEIAPKETRAWKIAMEFLAGKQGVFANEMGHDLLQRSRPGVTSYEEISLALARVERLTLRELIDEIKSAIETTFYTRQPLPSEIFEELKKGTSHEAGSTIEIVVEDFRDVEYLRELHSAGFSLFHGLGLPAQTIIFLDRKRGFLLAEHPEEPRYSPRPLKNTEDIYIRLLWRRFGHAVLHSGRVKETDIKGRLFSLATDGGREQWCRLKEHTMAQIPPQGSEIEVFAWDKWVTHILEVLDLRGLEKHKSSP